MATNNYAALMHSTTPPPDIIEAALKVQRWAESQCARPGEAWAVGPVQSRAGYDALQVELYETKAWLRNAERILERQGCRRCDIPACNCSSYHKTYQWKE